MHDGFQRRGSYFRQVERPVERPRVTLDDETLRDGLQSPSVHDPSIEDKIEILHLMDALGIDTADIGLPGAGPRAVADVTRLAEEIRDSKLSISANCAGRTVIADMKPIAEIVQKTGVPISQIIADTRDDTMTPRPNRCPRKPRIEKAVMKRAPSA